MSNHDEIWDGDVLERRGAAKFLQRYLDSRYHEKSSEPGFVLAINAEWGYGKSFMIERWQRQNRSDNYPSVLFDAWQNDFTADPLLAFIAELEEELSAYFKRIPLPSKVRTETLRLLKNIWKPALAIIATAGAKHLVGMTLPSVKDLFESETGSDEAHDAKDDQSKDPDEKAKTLDELKQVGTDLKTELDKALEAHRTVKAALTLFKEKLSILITHLADHEEINLPIYIFVDELDRCRPSYAIELLEGIKHLFGVPGLYFIVATNLNQLSESIKAVYGSGFDGQRYLKRFFDLQYTLGEPSNEKFSKLLTSSMMIPRNIKLIHGLDERNHMTEDRFNYNNNIESLNYILAKHADAFDLGLRDQKQIAILIEASLHSISNEPIHIFLLVFLAVLYHQDFDEFRRASNTYSLREESKAVQKIRTTQKGFIGLKFYDREGRVQKRNSGILDIATTYLSNIHHKNLRSCEKYHEEFPSSLLNDVKLAREGSLYWAPYKNYFHVIQQAGGFTDQSIASENGNY